MAPVRGLSKLQDISIQIEVWYEVHVDYPRIWRHASGKSIGLQSQPRFFYTVKVWVLIKYISILAYDIWQLRGKVGGNLKQYLAPLSVCLKTTPLCCHPNATRSEAKDLSASHVSHCKNLRWNLESDKQGNPHWKARFCESPLFAWVFTSPAISRNVQATNFHNENTSRPRPSAMMSIISTLFIRKTYIKFSKQACARVDYCLSVNLQVPLAW